MVVTAVCALLFIDALSELFIYHRVKVAAGEYWRLVSGHFVHTTTMHLLLNLAAWWLIWGYGRAVCNNWTWGVLLLCCALGTSAGLFVFQPELIWYTGISGVLHGLFIAVAVLRLSVERHDYSAWFIFAVTVVKLGYEHFQGPTSMTATFVGVRVISEAHWYGAVSGALTVAAISAVRRWRRLPRSFPHSFSGT